MAVFSWGSLQLTDGQLWIRKSKLNEFDETYDAQVGDLIAVHKNGKRDLFEIAGVHPDGDKFWLLKVDWMPKEEIEVIARAAA